MLRNRLKSFIAVSVIILFPSISFGAADKALNLFANPTANDRTSPDYYIGIYGGSSTGSNLNGENINVPLLGGGKAGIYFSRYFGIEVSGLMGPMGSMIGDQKVNTSQTTYQTVPAQTTISSTSTIVKEVPGSGGGMDQTYCGNYECNSTTIHNGKGKTTITTITDDNEGYANGSGYEKFTKTTSVTTYPTTSSVSKANVQQSTSQANQTLNIESAMAMVRLPLTYVSFYAGAGPALLNAPNLTEGVLSAKAGAEVPFGMIGVFGEEQFVFVPTGGMLGMALGGINVHF